MPQSDVEIVRSAYECWQALVEAVDLAGLPAYLDEFYDPDVWVDFGTRTPDAVPGQGTGVILRWARFSFPRWQAGDIRMRYEADDFIDKGDAVLVPARAVARIAGLDLENRFVYVFRLRDGKIISLTMHETLDEALAAADEAPKR